MFLILHSEWTLSWGPKESYPPTFTQTPLTPTPASNFTTVLVMSTMTTVCSMTWATSTVVTHRVSPPSDDQYRALGGRVPLLMNVLCFTKDGRSQCVRISHTHYPIKVISTNGVDLIQLHHGKKPEYTTPLTFDSRWVWIVMNQLSSKAGTISSSIIQVGGPEHSFATGYHFNRGEEGGGLRIKACNYYCKNFQVVKKIIDSFDSNEATSIKVVQELLSDPEIAGMEDVVSASQYILPSSESLPSSAMDLSTVLPSTNPTPWTNEDYWQKYLARYLTNEKCVGGGQCELVFKEHYHCMAEGCEMIFRSMDGVREHTRNHEQQEHVSETFFITETGLEGSSCQCEEDCPYQNKEKHYHCTWGLLSVGLAGAAGVTHPVRSPVKRTTRWEGWRGRRKESWQHGCRGGRGNRGLPIGACKCERQCPSLKPIERGVLFGTEYNGEIVTGGSENMDCGAVQALERVGGAACISVEERYKCRLNSEAQQLGLGRRQENCREIILPSDKPFRRLDHYKMHEYSRKLSLTKDPLTMTHLATSIDGMFRRKRGRPPKNRVIEGIHEIIEEAKVRWYGNIMRMEGERIPRRLMDMKWESPFYINNLCTFISSAGIALWLEWVLRGFIESYLKPGKFSVSLVVDNEVERN
uniref:C2H2-type domain-containing protein n=1 Tax=Timema bartmani TaxID=61472 RepID=A0A7R9HVY6_9NEOP|nr:unnamed protein product [Timema bartmani]